MRAERPLPHARDLRDLRALRVAGAVIVTYLAATLWPMLRYTGASGERLPLALHLAALAIALAVTLPGEPPHWLRRWMPLAMGPFLYVELRWLIVGTGLPHHDAAVIGWEHALFHGDPSAAWAPAAPWLPLSEWLHLAYASYYLLVLLPPVLLAVRGRRDDYARTVLALTVVYASCFTAYLFFPVDGPRFLVGPADAPDGPVRRFVLHLLAAGSSRGTAFPSSHVAASVVATCRVLQYDRRAGALVALLTAGLVAGTVYGGFHYGVDALAGLVAGWAAWRAADAVWRRLSMVVSYVEPGTQRATAA